MDQKTNYFSFPTQRPKPLFLPSQNTFCFPQDYGMASIPRGGAAMEWNSSNQSNSTISSDGTYFSSASSDSMDIGDALSQYGWCPSKYSQYPEVVNSPQTHVDYQTQATPSSLGWSTETQLWKLYRFIVPKGKEPYLELLPQWTVTAETPPKVFLDPPKTDENPKWNHHYPCQFPGGCLRKDDPFNRPADLERHYKHVHAEINEDECFRCDYPRCARFKEPFTRKDHFRDHLREFHKEDLGCAKGEKNTRDPKKLLAKQKQWWEERQINSKWWRCIRCLVRVHVTNEGWDCPKCNAACEAERKEARKVRATKEDETASLTSTSQASVCSVCNGMGWLDSISGGYATCPSCGQEPSLGESHYPATNAWTSTWRYP